MYSYPVALKTRRNEPAQILRPFATVTSEEARRAKVPAAEGTSIPEIMASRVAVLPVVVAARAVSRAEVDPEHIVAEVTLGVTTSIREKNEEDGASSMLKPNLEPVVEASFA
jgi:hypothetical protein